MKSWNKFIISGLLIIVLDLTNCLQKEKQNISHIGNDNNQI